MAQLTALLLTTFFVANAAAADGTAEARAARFYAEGLEAPLLQLRAGALLVQACQGRLRRGCGKDQVDLAADGRLIALLDALTLFPQRLDSDPAASAMKPKDLQRKMLDTSAALLRTAGDYDAKVFARYGAAMTVCPDEDLNSFETWLEEVMRLELHSFRALDAQAATDVTRAIAEEKSALAKSLSQAPKEDCLAARKLGEYLVQLMAFKLQPWRNPGDAAASRPDFNFAHPKKEDARPRTPKEDRDLAHAVAGNFISVVATELQLQVFPETEARIKALTDQAGVPSRD